MNKNIYLLTFLVFSLSFWNFACNVNKKIEGAMQDKIQQIEKKYAPDTRVEIFDIEVVNKGGAVYLEGITSSEEAYQEINQTIKDMKEKNITNQIRLLPEQNLEYKQAIINLSVGNIRSEPRHSATLVTQALLGTPVKIYQKDGWWYRIQTPDNYLGWIDGSGIEPLAQEDIKSWNNSEKIIFTNKYGSVYQDKDKSSQPVSDIVMGNILKMEDRSWNWFEVSFPDGRKGYIDRDQAQIIDEWMDAIELTGESIVNLAKSFQGIPYLWGGTSIKGADCSGFVKSVYFMHGIILQRDASQQTLYGELVPIEENYDQLQAGDLLFFGKERVTHVGIYMDDYKFIHASGRVKINSLNKADPDYSKSRESSLIRARRILGSLDNDGISLLKNNKFYK